jgi:predicted neuraminidase
MKTAATIPIPTPSCHASTLVELQGGDLLMAWFGGTEEGHADVAIWASRCMGGVWSPPHELVKERGVPTWNPVLFRTGDGRLWLYYKYGPNPRSWCGARMVSEDDGRTWSRPEHLPAGLYGPIRARPLVMDDGTIVSGTSVEAYRSWAAWIERSEDHGATWAKIGPISVPLTIVSSPADDDAPGTNDWAHTDGIIQPSIVSLDGDRLRLYARSTARTGRVCVADSPDRGRTWTQARPIDVPNPNSGIDAVTLRDGRVLLIYNHTTHGRSPLNLALSDDGERFTMVRTLEDEPDAEFSYPNVLQGRDGALHMSWTWKRAGIRYLRLEEREL